MIVKLNPLQNFAINTFSSKY